MSTPAAIEIEKLELWFNKNTSIPVLRLLILTGFDVNTVDNSGRNTKLLRSVYHENVDIIKYLLSIPGIDVNKPDYSGAVPLHYAKSEEIVRLLVEAGANINALTLKGTSPIMINKTDDAIRYLVSKGADLTIKNMQGETVFDRHRIHSLLKTKIDIIHDNLNELNDDEKVSVVEKTSMGLSKEQKSKLIQKILASF
jgi:ankyrin repeat protein